jgi:hypothetical protein
MAIRKDLVDQIGFAGAYGRSTLRPKMRGTRPPQPREFAPRVREPIERNDLGNLEKAIGFD